MGCHFCFTKAVEGISSSINETENLKQSSEDLISSYNSALDTFKSHKEIISEISDEYSKLSSSVNSLGENVSLSTDDFEKYRDLNNQIADMVTRYNSQGDTILSLKGNVEALTDALKEEEKATHNSLVASVKNFNGNDIMKYYKDITEGSLWDKITGKANSISKYTALNDVLGMTDVNDFNSYMETMNLAWGSGMDNGIYHYLTSLGYAMDMIQDEFDALIEKNCYNVYINLKST